MFAPYWMTVFKSCTWS